MGILRTYFSKDNTIIRNSYVNTGRNPIAELFHGGSLNPSQLKYSRYIFDLNFTEILKKIDSKAATLDSMTHTLKITNTASFDQEQFCRRYDSLCIGDVKRATCFDLILFEIPEEWCEGNGYDCVPVKIACVDSDKTYCEGPSNWYQRESVISCWSNPGIYNDPTNWCPSLSGTSGCTTGTTVCTGGTNLVIATQHFDHGDENVCIDITNYINGLITSGYTGLTYGLGLAFDYPLEIAPLEDAEYVGFFGRETNTVYEPFLETTWNDTIKDDRDSFYYNKENNLCLYVNAGGQATNATFSGVTIYDQNENVYTIIPPSGITQVTTGVYCVKLQVDENPNLGYCGELQFKDTWNDVTIGTKNLGDVELEFVILDDSGYYSIGGSGSAKANGLGVGSSNNISIYEYDFNITGIKYKEKIKRGDTRRINIDVRIPYTFDQTVQLDKVYYRIFIKESGSLQLDYIDWQEISRTPNGNFFLVDTSWFIPNDYFIEIKIESGNEVRTSPTIIPFTIVSEEDWCKAYGLDKFP
jgi:hypothetical protein